MRAISENCYEFGEFRLDADEQLLFRRDVSVEITPKAFGILLLLARNPGRTVTKEEIFQQVWPDSFVEETNLSHHVFRLRKILGETENQKFIETVPRRGYRFVADISRVPVNGVSGLPAAEHTASDGRRPRYALVLTGAAVVLLLFAGAFVLYRSRATEQDQHLPDVNSPLREQSISRITDGGKFVAATISPDGKFVAYGQNYTSGEGMLYIRQLETNTERRLLTPGDRNFGTISFSPDGTFVYYIAYETRDPEGALYRIPVIGGETAKVLDGVKFMFSLSPDGKQAAFYRFDDGKKQRSLNVAFLNGNPDEKAVLTFSNSVISSVPAFSPDGRFISFSVADADSDFSKPQFTLSVFDVTTSTTKQLSDEKWSEIGKAVWRPDGTGLVFVGKRPRTGIQIYTMDFPSGKVRQITDELNYYGNYGMGITRDGSTIVADLWDTQSQLWSIDADGSSAGAEQLTNGVSDGSVGLASLRDGQIIYSARSGEDRDIWLLRDSGGFREGRPLTADAASEAGVCAPRDGAFIIFASDRAGGPHLFRMNSDGADVTPITSGNGSENSPECAADGSFVLYDSGGRIWKVGSTGGEAKQLTDNECIAPSLSPDGKYFACIQPAVSQIENATLAVVPIEGGTPVKTFKVIPFGHYYRPARWTTDGRGLTFTKIEKQIGNLWRQDIAGGQPRKITDFRSEVILNHAFSSDGKQLIVSRGKVAFNTVMIRNFN